MNRADLSQRPQVRREVYLSGQSVPAGVYRNLFSGREILQADNSPLPPDTEGTPAVYVRLARPLSLPLTKSIRNH